MPPVLLVGYQSGMDSGQEISSDYMPTSENPESSRSKWLHVYVHTYDHLHFNYHFSRESRLIIPFQFLFPLFPNGAFGDLFVCYCGQRPSLLWNPALRPYSGPLRLPRERKEIGRCVRCVLATSGKGRLSRSEQLVGYFYSVPLLDVAYCLSVLLYSCVYYASKWPATAIYFDSCRRGRQT